MTSTKIKTIFHFHDLCLPVIEQDGRLPRPDLVGKVLYTYVIRAKLCQKALRRATECHYGHLN